MAIGARRFRRGLPVEQVEVDGYKFLQVQRPGGEPFRLYDFEYQVALELNGQPLEQVARAVKANHGLELTKLQVMAFVDRLGELDLLEPDGDVGSTPARVSERRAAVGAPQPRTREEQAEALEDEVTGDHGRAALNLMAASRAAKREDAPGRAQQPSAWHEAEPTSLMSNMGNLLEVSRARTGETGVTSQRGADDDAMDVNPSRRGSSSDLGTREMMIAASQFDAPFGGARQDPHLETRDRGGPQPPPLENWDRGGPQTSPVETPDWGGPQPSDIGGRLSEPHGIAEQAPAADQGSPPRRLWLWALVAVGLAIAAAFALFRFMQGPSTAPVSVDTVLPSPVAAYRWFETPGKLEAASAATLSLPAGGKLVELREVGARFSAGDTLATTEEGKRIRKEMDHLKERLAYYQQMLDAMVAEGNRSEARQAEIKLKEKQALLDDVSRAYAQVAIVASTEGIVGKHLAKLGDKINPGAPVLALQDHQMRAVFQLSPDDAEHAQRLAFCRVLINDRPHDCGFVGSADSETVVVELSGQVEAEAGSPSYLARARFDGVFAIPASAVVQIGNTERLFVAAPTGHAEVRAVSLADRSDKEVLVAQGLDVGDAVIVDVPATLTPNGLINVSSRLVQ